MKTSSIIAFACIITLPNAVNSQSGQNQDASANIIEYEYSPDENGYHLRFKTSNGIERNEEAVFENVNGIPLLRIKGNSQYIGRDNKIYYVDYTADENGYRPTIRESGKGQGAVAYVSPVLIKSLTGAK